jgi:hypothetical protein
MIIPLISRPTRVTAHSATLIDNIFTNCFSHYNLSGNILNDLSDHFPIFAFFNNEYIPQKTELKSVTREKFVKHPTPTLEKQYKAYKNKLIHLTRIAKRTYYDDKFEQSNNDLKATWKLINEIINKKNNKRPLPSSFNSNGRTITDPVKIANEFCHYLPNIGPTLASKIQTTNSAFQNFVGPANDQTIYLRPTSISELMEICSSFSSKKAPGYDNIPMILIKNSVEFIIVPLMNIISLSLETGVFPEKLKMAKVIPIFKADDPESFKNYRPISILSNFSKFFERVMHIRLSEFVQKYEILYCYQFGFRKNHSTDLALTHLVNKITSSIAEGGVTAGVFLDLSKAFDTINHQILYYKLERYVIRGVALQWIKSYFENRKKFVQYNNVSSSANTITCGVLQSSILGPLFFILYINDLPNALNITESLLFADDTSMYYSHTDPISLINVLNDELRNVDRWMKANKLSVNITKTNYIIFKSRNEKFCTDIPVIFDGKPLMQKKIVRFLGVHIDENLTWKSHISHVCKKISKSIGILFRSLF